jgi:predicted RNA-binding protein with PIN domain
VKRRRNNKSNQVDASEVVRRLKSELIIDGYNLMHVTRFKPRGNNDGELKRCREGMLALLATHLPADRYRRITIVFDSGRAPCHLPDQFNWQHINVCFARDENSADDLIAIMIQQAVNPTQLVVVSSDHRVQVAARRRRATGLDSDRWFDAVLEQEFTGHGTQTNQPTNSESKASSTMSKEDLDEFREAMKDPIEIEAAKDDEAADEFENPFPDGYFDGIEEE